MPCAYCPGMSCRTVSPGAFREGAIVTFWIALRATALPVKNCTWTLWRPIRPLVSQFKLRVQVSGSPVQVAIAPTGSPSTTSCRPTGTSLPGVPTEPYPVTATVPRTTSANVDLIDADGGRLTTLT